ncbi:ribonuclease P protein component [Patiriisocius marinistellae]|uniref:Ribonuclease P protein component n=1 Tax=Patiriisocius marinistellae TaxID=2494560 RepID=A0A5J4FUQ2_9FLAO|nr:ribonuclease P protein component [Patiriisocius marinistellae]GEQ84898.1 ribonuclease P protein component [Patiriisocius marinistellae]
MSFKFPKQEKLKSRKVISQLFAEGKSYSKFPIKVLYLPADEADVTKVTFAVPKKNFKKAVSRNRIKRLLREAYRLNKTEYLEINGKKFVLLFIYLGKDEFEFKKVQKAMVFVLKKLNLSST